MQRAWGRREHHGRMQEPEHRGRKSVSKVCMGRWQVATSPRASWVASREVLAVPRAVENTEVGFWPGMGKAGEWVVRRWERPF